ncbi:MAG: glycerate dehydrogenase [Opitutus sp.]|nr:glycerate dehydrogenase [Opitutus sp.]
MPQIVVLDGHALNPGDLLWDELAALGELTVFDRTGSPDESARRCHDAEIVLTNKTPLTDELLGQLPRLRYVGVLATGYNVVDTAAATRRGIVVTNVPAYGTRSVAQHTIALLLELTNHVGAHSAGVRAGEWCRSPDWTYWSAPLMELDGLTLGLVGRGRIGNAVAEIAQALGLRVRSVGSRDSREQLLAMLSESDVISLHCPLTDATKQLINRETLDVCKPTALLLNTARGALIHEASLAAALHARRLGGAALDVLSSEPPAPENPLLGARNCLITPHLGWASFAARRRLLQCAVANVRAFLAGSPVNRVA